MAGDDSARTGIRRHQNHFMSLPCLLKKGASYEVGVIPQRSYATTRRFAQWRQRAPAPQAASNGVPVLLAIGLPGQPSDEFGEDVHQSQAESLRTEPRFPQASRRPEIRLLPQQKYRDVADKAMIIAKRRFRKPYGCLNAKPRGAQATWKTASTSTAAPSGKAEAPMAIRA